MHATGKFFLLLIFTNLITQAISNIKELEDAHKEHRSRQFSIFLVFLGSHTEVNHHLYTKPYIISKNKLFDVITGTPQSFCLPVPGKQ